MPTFRTAPSSSLTASVRRLVASGGANIGPLQEVQADLAAAQTARNMSLAEKARAEVEAMRRAEADRTNPELAAEYAGNAAGLDAPTSTRLANHLRGVLEQPSAADIEDAGAVGAEAKPFVTGAPNVEPGARRLFQSAIASTIANRLATGKTNAAQLAQSGDRINETALTQQAAEAPDVPTGNRIIAAVAGKLREPFKTGRQGQVLNEETGDVNEATDLASAAAALSGARTRTEGSRQAELGSRSTRNSAQATLASERAGAVRRGETGRGGQRVTPEQVERWVSETARKEWDTIPAKDRKGMSYAQHLDKVRERFKSAPGRGDAKLEVADAHAAIANGADRAKVAKRFKERMGFDMPNPADDEDDNEE